MFTYVQVSKNTYPYSTLHVDTCSALKRVRYPRTLNLTEVQRLDSVRIDKCARCMPYIGDKPGPEVSAFWAIQRAFTEEKAATWRKVHAARKVVALRLALEEAEAEAQAAFTSAVEQRDMVATIENDARTGSYTPLEVTVQRR